MAGIKIRKATEDDAWFIAENVLRALHIDEANEEHIKHLAGICRRQDTLQLGKKFSNYGISIFLLATLLNLRAKGIRNLTKRNGNSTSISFIIQVVFQDDYWK